MSNSTKRMVAAGVLSALVGSLAVAANADARTYYACVKKKSGGLRIVSATAKCKRTERKISFNSAGVPGKNGLNGHNGNDGKNGGDGTNGAKGEAGATGPGAVSFATTLPVGTERQTVIALSNGVSVKASCPSGEVGLELEATTLTSHIQLSGTANLSAPEKVVLLDSTSVLGRSATATEMVDFDVIARDPTVGAFARIDVHGSQGSPCVFWGMITPSE